MAALAAKPTAEFPARPTSLGTQTKQVLSTLLANAVVERLRQFQMLRQRRTQHRKAGRRAHIRVIDSATVPDHILIVTTLQSRRPPPVIQFARRDFKRLNHAELAVRLHDSVLFTAPPAPLIGSLTMPLESVITEFLDELVPFC